MTSYSERRRLDGRHIVVTGANGGIGRALCRRLRAEGATITAVCRRGDPDDVFWKQVRANLVTLDVSRPKEVIAQELASVAPLHGLVNLAGVESVQDFPDYDDDEFARVLNVNARGPLHLMQLLRTRMNSGTSIVNVITMDALLVLKTMAKSSALYAASKAALAMLTRELAAELGPDGIRVNGVAPGLIDTPTTAKIPNERRSWIVARTALRREGQPADIADAISFLLSDASRFITGQVLPVDGGMAAALYGPPEFATHL